MDYKIVFSDIDGTLLNTEHHVLPRTADAIRQITARGIPFALVSARMPEAIAPIVDEIGRHQLQRRTRHHARRAGAER